MPRKLYIGRNLPKTTAERDLEEVFAKYGKLTNVWVARNPPGFAYVEYEEERDAEEAVKNVPGTIVNGVPLTVEFAQSNGPKPRGSWNGGGGRGGYDRGAGGYDRGFDRGAGGYDRGYDRGAGGGGGGRYDWNPPAARDERRRSRSRSYGRGAPPPSRFDDRDAPRRDDYRREERELPRRDERDDRRGGEERELPRRDERDERRGREDSRDLGREDDRHRDGGR